jgi:hypothetical protein
LNLSSKRNRSLSIICGGPIFGDGLQAKNHSGVSSKRMASLFERVKLVALIGISMSSLLTVELITYKYRYWKLSAYNN